MSRLEQLEKAVRRLLDSYRLPMPRAEQLAALRALGEMFPPTKQMTVEVFRDEP